jgi:hypothetical protein
LEHVEMTEIQSLLEEIRADLQGWRADLFMMQAALEASIYDTRHRTGALLEQTQRIALAER